MNRIPRLAVVAAVAMAILSGCAVPGAGPQKLGGSPPGSSHPGVAPVPGTEQGAISITLSSRGCAPRPSAVESGSGYLTFTVTPTDREQNLGVELRGPGGVLADQENLRSGQSGRFWLQLSPGSYTVRCPGARLQLLGRLLSTVGTVQHGPLIRYWSGLSSSTVPTSGDRRPAWYLLRTVSWGNYHLGKRCV